MRARNSTYAQTYPSLTEDLSRADVLALADIIQRIKGIALFRIKGMEAIRINFYLELTKCSSPCSCHGKPRPVALIFPNLSNLTMPSYRWLTRCDACIDIGPQERSARKQRHIFRFEISLRIEQGIMIRCVYSTLI